MNRLLHSQLFRKNLYRWLFLYVAVLCLATSVITYSKYISNLSRGDEKSRSASFNITVAPYNTLNKFECSSDGACTTVSSFRPTQQIAYYYEVDPIEVEVKARVTLRATVSDDYRIISVSEVDKDGNAKGDNLYTYVDETSLTKLTHSDKFKTYSFKTNFLIDEEEIKKDPSLREKRYYKIVIEYIPKQVTEGEYKGDYVFNNDINSGLVGIGFSAEQLAK